MPPATATSRSPARTAWSTMPAARRPEAQTLLTVSEETSFGIPPLICAWREGICPCPACSTWPKTTCWTCSGPTSARSSAAAMAVPPRSVASRLARPPPSLPKGVRAAPRMTVLGIADSLARWGARNDIHARRRRPRHRRSLAVLRLPPMRAISVSTRAGEPADTAADTRVVGLFEGETLPDPALQALVELGEARPGLKKVAVTHEGAPGGGQRRVLIAGLGKRERAGRRARAGRGGGRRRARARARRRVALVGAARRRGRRRGARRGHAAASSTRSTASSPPRATTRAASSRSSSPATASRPTRSSGRAWPRDAANRARDLQNLPANVATPAFLADRATEIADEHEALELELLDRDAIVARGMGAFAAVAQGSDVEPRLIVLRYRPTGARGPAPRLRRQGRDLRHRRHLDQARLARCTR